MFINYKREIYALAHLNLSTACFTLNTPFVGEIKMYIYLLYAYN